MGREPWSERFWRMVAWLLPRPLVKWCAIRMFAHATQGKWSHEECPTILVPTMLERWNEDGAAPERGAR